eukprot:364027-Chlamydomonas_euryale.AAC.3
MLAPCRRCRVAVGYRSPHLGALVAPGPEQSSCARMHAVADAALCAAMQCDKAAAGGVVCVRVGRAGCGLRQGRAGRGVRERGNCAQHVDERHLLCGVVYPKVCHARQQGVSAEAMRRERRPPRLHAVEVAHGGRRDVVRAVGRKAAFGICERVWGCEAVCTEGMRGSGSGRPEQGSSARSGSRRPEQGSSTRSRSRRTEQGSSTRSRSRRPEQGSSTRSGSRRPSRAAAHAADLGALSRAAAHAADLGAQSRAAAHAADSGAQSRAAVHAADPGAQSRAAKQGKSPNKNMEPLPRNGQRSGMSRSKLRKSSQSQTRHTQPHEATMAE